MTLRVQHVFKQLFQLRLTVQFLGSLFAAFHHPNRVPRQPIFSDSFKQHRVLTFRFVWQTIPDTADLRYLDFVRLRPFAGFRVRVGLVSDEVVPEGAKPFPRSDGFRLDSTPVRYPISAAQSRSYT